MSGVLMLNIGLFVKMMSILKVLNLLKSDLIVQVIFFMVFRKMVMFTLVLVFLNR